MRDFYRACIDQKCSVRGSYARGPSYSERLAAKVVQGLQRNLVGSFDPPELMFRALKQVAS